MRASVVIGRTLPDAPGDLLLDFRNENFRKDGVTDTFSALGGSLYGGATITPGSGLICNASGEYAEISYGLTGDFMLVALYGSATSIVTRRVCDYTGGSNSLVSILNSSDPANVTIRTRGSSGLPTNTSSALTNPQKIAVGKVGSVRKFSVNGAAVVTQNPGDVFGDFASGILTVGGDTVPWTDPIRSIAIFKGTFTDAQIQALSV